MDQVLKDINHFASQTFGLEQLPVTTKAITSFQIGEGKKLFLEVYGDNLLIYLNLQLQKALTEKYLAALKACHFSNPQPYPVQVGLTRRDTLVFLTTLPLNEVQPREIKLAFEQLFTLADKIKAN